MPSNFRQCVFCKGRADSREHVFAKRLCERAQAKTLSVIAGMYTEGEGIQKRPEHLLDALTVRHVCAQCNNGWMNKLEAWFERRFGCLIEPDWPRLDTEFIRTVGTEPEKLTEWLIKTAVMFNLSTIKGKARVEFPPETGPNLLSGKIPDFYWVDVGYSKLCTVGARIGPCFRTVNGGKYHPSQVFAGLGFDFIVQFNHLLLRIARAPGTKVDYDQAFGGCPVRLYPIPDQSISVVPKYSDFVQFQHSVVLRTHLGC